MRTFLLVIGVALIAGSAAYAHHSYAATYDVTKEINLDDYAGLPFQIWASTPAVLWTAERPQERGIHVHVYQGGEYCIDDTFGVVRYEGKILQRSDLLSTMVAGTIN